MHQIINVLVCTNATEDCYSKRCNLCGDHYPSSILIQSYSVNLNDEDEATWFNWISASGKVHLQEINRNLATLLDNIDEQWPVILHRHYIKNQQKLYIDNIKQKSNESDYIVISCDFAENYTLTAQREVQSTQWNRQQAAIFTIHIKIGDSHVNLSIVSDYLSHDTAFVYCSQQVITNFVRSKFPLVKKIIYVSDGAAMHFKNKYNMVNLSFHKSDFGLEAEWLCTATAHGKSACDGKI